ncbi:hypothetical protein [Streptomyces sp. CB02460]|uniref:hypothetical protein n=1 Tax=Streptomyces sp. CB02460 TaxID=1703941 RepID=UPI001F5B0D54|nr:hypothetical protein [Streptomyces sp. CB02460]
MHTPADWLKLTRAGADGAVLHPLAHSPYVFVRQALAANPATAPRTLLELTGTRDSPWNDNKLLLLLAQHPHADRTVLRAVLDAAARSTPAARARAGAGGRQLA